LLFKYDGNLAARSLGDALEDDAAIVQIIHDDRHVCSRGYPMGKILEVPVVLDVEFLEVAHGSALDISFAMVNLRIS